MHWWSLCSFKFPLKIELVINLNCISINVNISKVVTSKSLMECIPLHIPLLPLLFLLLLCPAPCLWTNPTRHWMHPCTAFLLTLSWNIATSKFLFLILMVQLKKNKMVVCVLLLLKVSLTIINTIECRAYKGYFVWFKKYSGHFH